LNVKDFRGTDRTVDLAPHRHDQNPVLIRFLPEWGLHIHERIASVLVFGIITTKLFPGTRCLSSSNQFKTILMRPENLSGDDGIPFYFH
jgi:hypothetical protein